MDWDNVRFFLEVARTGRLQLAAQRLQVEYTTVARRIQQLEKVLGQTLFVRDRQGYLLTEAGKQLLVQAERMEDASLLIQQQAGTDAQGLSGLVRVGVTEGYGTFFLAQHLASLSQQHPHLAIDLVAVPRLVNLSRREADIVITLERPSRGAFVMTKLTDYVLRLYASPAYLSQHSVIQNPDDLAQHTFVSYIDDLLMSQTLNYLSELCSPKRVAFRSTSLLGQQQAALAGAGIAILPAFMASQEPRLVAVLPQQLQLTRTFWMMMPTDLKDVARMRMTWDFIKTMTQQQQALMLGLAPSDSNTPAVFK
ncbi:LysR family transcriptional regulator [Alkanindiges sp. WGS2144]|uniref:LysR family transcriptional regulator n=1 Tax=Alkanindiges sp. WGS2144 TaxID=3366808 RepID=UPI003752278E